MRARIDPQPTSPGVAEETTCRSHSAWLKGPGLVRLRCQLVHTAVHGKVQKAGTPFLRKRARSRDPLWSRVGPKERPPVNECSKAQMKCFTEINIRVFLLFTGHQLHIGCTEPPLKLLPTLHGSEPT